MRLPPIVKRAGKTIVKSSPILRRHIMSSSDHRVLSGLDEAKRMTASSTGWLAARTVARQERAHRGLIAAMKRGEPRLDFQVAAEAIAATGIAQPRADRGRLRQRLLFGSVRKRCSRMPSATRGMDYSQAMIALARAALSFKGFRRRRRDTAALRGRRVRHRLQRRVADAYHRLPGGDPPRPPASQRVTAVFHGVPVFRDYRTTFLTKYAYGAPVVEIIFGRQELMSVVRGRRSVLGTSVARHRLRRVRSDRPSLGNGDLSVLGADASKLCRE